MGIIATPLQAGGRTAMKEINVIGTMQLLAACQKASSVQRLVVKSTSSVYGAGPRDPAMFTEEAEPRHSPRSGWAKDSAEVEGYVRGFARRRPDVAVTTLRFANFIGPGVNTPMTSYFSLPAVPTVAGFDARLQFIHEDDGLEAVRIATVGEAPGPDQRRRRRHPAALAGDPAHRPSVDPDPAASGVDGRQGLHPGRTGGLLARAGPVPDLRPRDRHPPDARGARSSHRQYTTSAAFNDFVASRNLNRLATPQRVAAVESGLLSVIGVPRIEQEARHA